MRNMHWMDQKGKYISDIYDTRIKLQSFYINSLIVMVYLVHDYTKQKCILENRSKWQQLS